MLIIKKKMDPYIRDYCVNSIETVEVHNIQEYNDIQNSLINNFEVMHLNIRSMSKNFDELCVFLSQFCKKFDVIVLSETFQIYDKNVFCIDGYQMIYNESNINKNDGVVVFIKSHLDYTFKLIKLGEITAIELNIQCHNTTLMITSVYRSPQTNPYTFNESLSNYLNNIKSDISVLVGDININLFSHEYYVEEYMNILNMHGYISYINKYTRTESETCLDHFFIRSNKHKNGTDIKSIVYRQDITDHSPIMVLFPFESRHKDDIEQKKYKKYINFNNLKKDLQWERWQEIYESNDANLITHIFIKKLTYYIEKNTKVFRIKNVHRKRKEWITSGLVKSINTKTKMYKNLLKQPHDIILQRQYKTYKNTLTKLIKKTKHKYYKSLIDQNQGSSKRLWDVVNTICQKSDTKVVINKIKLENGSIAENKKDISNAFNKHYCNLGETYAQKITQPIDFIENYNTLENTMYLYPTNDTEVKKTIKELKQKKAPGYDGIRSETLKKVSEEIASHLTYIVNKCFSTGCFPECLKIGIVKPLYKGGDILEILNYRPISLISNISKIIEKIAKSRITQFIDKFKIMSPRQYGFREGKSTEDAIFDLTSHIYEALDKSKPILCIFVDLAKAFDTVCHRKLLHKLKNYGLRGRIFDFLKSYLENRTQFVNIDEVISDAGEVKYGVPQGTVLGPLLFSLYINNLLALNSTGKIISFADDTVILFEAESWNEIKEIAEREFKIIKKWFQYNTLTLNVNKTSYITFSSYATYLPTLGPLNIDTETTIQETQSTKYLGIHIDQHFRWDLQINSLIKKIRGLLQKFKYLKNILPIKSLKTLYYSLVQSHLSYGIMGWGGVQDCYLKNLNVLQKWILKIIYGKERNYPSNELYKESGICDVRQLFSLSILKYTFKNKTLLEKINHNYETRYRDEYRSPFCSKAVGQRSVPYIAPKLYSILPTNVQNITKFVNFKNQVKTWILQTPRQVIDSVINQR